MIEVAAHVVQPTLAPDMNGPSEDITVVADAMFDFARGMLRRQRQFYPFGAVLPVGGQVDLVSGSDLAHPWAGDDELAGLLEQHLARKAAAENVAAAGICTQRDSTVVVQVEHRTGRAITLTMAFKAKRLGRAVAFGAIEAGEGRHAIFPSPG